MRPPRFRNLTLVLTDRCNMSCSFCYVPKARGRTMRPELADQAVSLLLADSRQQRMRQQLSVSFFGGEPFLAPEPMAAAIKRARKMRQGRPLSFSAPTNGTLLDAETLSMVDAEGIRLAASLDKAQPEPGGSVDHCLASLDPAHRDALRKRAFVARMTVTPENVGQLCDNVVGLFAAGFTKLMHQPALEAPWPEAAIGSWADQHRRLADWACERYRRHQALPELQVLEGIIARLGGRPSRGCGVGVSQAAVDPDGRVFGCFRSVYDPRAEQLVLARVVDGELVDVNAALLARYARLDARRARPEQRDSCRGCDARDGCNIYCPATGHVRLGDLRGVSADACALARAQVEICRDLVRRMRRLQRQHRRHRLSAKVAAAALAVGLASGSAACDDSRSASVTSDAGDAAADVGADIGPDLAPGLCLPGLDTAPGVCPADFGPGVCAPGVCDAPPPPDYGPGLCPEEVDIGLDGPDGWPDGPGGLCPPPGLCMPGVCPIAPDVGIDAQAVDAGVDVEPPGPGLCPVPGIC